MWKPPQRIKYESRPGPWPSRLEAEASMLFSPVRVGPLELRHRTWVPAMVPWRATEEGHVTDEVLAWYERFAQGRPAALVVEATGIRDIRSGPLLRIGDDRFLPGLAELVDTVRRASAGQTRLFIQIIDFLVIRRRPPRDRFLREFLEISADHRRRLPDCADDDAIRARLLAMDDDALRAVLGERHWEALTVGYRERVTDLHLDHVRELPRILPELFASAARRAREVGFDGVELHYAHAYTMASFLSARNSRGDGYGGSRDNRVRLPLEVYRAVRDAVGDDWVVGCRYLTEDCIEAGSTVDDAVWFGRRFAEAGMDFLSTSRGGKFEDAKQPKEGWAAYPYTGPSGYECMPQNLSDEQGPFGRNVGPTSRVRRALAAAGLDTPVVVTGGIHGFRHAEEILRRGDADIIGAARQSLADPDWYRKILLGRGNEVRVCQYTNYCEGLDQKHKQVTCQLWDREQLGPGVARSRDGRRRLVAPPWQPAGGGDAGSS